MFTLLFVWWQVGKWLNTPGKVVIQYLPIIQPNEAATRDDVRNVSLYQSLRFLNLIFALIFEMLRLSRRRMLTALMSTPDGVCDPLSAWEHTQVYLVGTSVLTFNIIAVQGISSFVMNTFSISSGMTFIYFILFSGLITAMLYTYFLYINDVVKSRNE